MSHGQAHTPEKPNTSSTAALFFFLLFFLFLLGMFNFIKSMSGNGEHAAHETHTEAHAE